jgi:hypothetical protein
MHFIEKSARMDGGRFALFEAGLIDLRRDHMRAGRLDLLEDGLLHDLRDMRPHHDGSDLIEGHWTL